MILNNPNILAGFNKIVLVIIYFGFFKLLDFIKLPVRNKNRSKIKGKLRRALRVSFRKKSKNFKAKKYNAIVYTSFEEFKKE